MLYILHMQMSMNARPLSLTSATPTPCVMILKDPTRVVVVEDIPETEGHVQVMHIVKTHFSDFRSPCILP